MKSRKPKRNNNIVNIQEKIPAPRKRKKTSVSIIPRNTAQENYLIHLEDTDNKIILATGPAGTGKTIIGVSYAIQQLMADTITKIVLTRPAIGADGEKHGFLPGDLNQKMEPWLLPILDVFNEYYSKDEVKNMIEEGIIEVAPIAYLRGRTFHNSIIIADEFQNTTESQAKCVMTRIGEGSRLIITGDLNQSDLYKANGLRDITDKVRRFGSTMIAICEFGRDHVERSAIVSEVLRLYGDD